MSQHTFETGTYLVQTGWDRPLQYYFLNIYRRADDALVYSNLHDPLLVGGAMTTAQIAAKLAALDITPPRQLLANLARDGMVNAGNAVTIYDPEMPLLAEGE